jgi:hypothetical protein
MPDPSRVTIETSVPKDSVGPNKPTSPNPDAFFLSPSSLIGVELKLDSPTWPEQIGKYLALMVWEELKGQKEAKEGKKRERKPRAFVCCPGDGSRATPIEDWGRWSEPSL